MTAAAHQNRGLSQAGRMQSERHLLRQAFVEALLLFEQQREQELRPVASVPPWSEPHRRCTPHQWWDL